MKYTVKEVAQLLQCTCVNVYELIAKDEIEAIKNQGKQIKIQEDEIMKYISNKNSKDKKKKELLKKIGDIDMSIRHMMILNSFIEGLTKAN